MIFWIALFFFLGIMDEACPLDRCSEYVVDVRAQSVKQLGLGFPYWYAVGQLRQESACRADVTALDKGQGLAQFMPTTARYVNSLMGMNLDPYNPQHAIKMQLFYLAWIHRRDNWDDHKVLFIDFQIYNGGRTNLYNEYKRAGASNWAMMKSKCQRAKNFCEINYDYSQKVFKYGQAYKRGFDSPFMFW